MGYRKRVNQAELSRILGVSHQAIAKMKPDPSFPEFDKGGLAEIYAVCVWWYLRKEANPVPTDESLLSGDSSDGLERYRQARAGLAEIELAKERGSVIKLDDAAPAIEVVLSEIRKLFEHAKRTGDSEWFDMLSECNVNVEKGLEKLCGLSGSTNADSVGSVCDPVQ